ncbi:MAG: hypothetical protein JO235_28855 [Chroococcidiopsidaceae cyanobacterium CP_BM_RX_35]|nr:hypothetical protein [Chroococcidiopsidaceae cyanobacterium CP_BM_RX_35]
MMQLGQTETRLEDSEIKPGDVVRLLQSFRPERFRSRKYTFAIVAGIVRDAAKSDPSQQSSSGSQPIEKQLDLDEIIVYLYEPHSSTIYVDQYGHQALFSFASNEVERYRVSEAPAIPLSLS